MQNSFFNPPPVPTPSKPSSSSINAEWNEDGYSVKGCSYIYAPKGQAGEYSPLASNPYRGCGHKCAYCLDGDTPIQMSDGTTKTIRDIQVGDKIIGIKISGNERSWNTRITSTTVQAKVKTRKPAYKIHFSDQTSVICSADHRWLTDRGWKYTTGEMCGDERRPYLTVNNSIRRITNGAQLTPALEGSAVSSSAKIVAIEEMGEIKDMYDITTGTENFVANGLVSHNCYVPQVIKMDRAEFDNGAFPRPDFLKNLTKDAKKYQTLGSRGQVMLSFTTDPFNPFDRSLTRPTIEILKSHGLSFCTLTKGGSRALEYIDLFRPDRDAFASTLTSLDDKFSKLWERGAALPQDRMDTLRKFHDAGIFTWVSCEPTLDVEATLAIIEQTRSYVDFYKIGRVNYVGLTKTTDWETFTHRVIDLCQKYDIKHYIKKDLQQYLPAGYPNVMRIDQHN